MGRSRGVRHLVAQALGHHQAGAWAQAESLYLQVLAAEPHHALAVHNLALILAESGRGRDAQKRLERLLKARPDEAAPHLLLGRLLGAEGKATRSLFHLRRALALAPGRLENWLDAIAAAATQRRPDAALTMAEQAAPLFPTRPELSFQIGMGLLENAQPEPARIWFNRALAADADYAPALYNLAIILQTDGNPAAALRMFRHANRVDPQHALPPTCLGDLELRLGDVPAANASLDAWLEQYPNDAAAISNRLMAAQYVPGVTAESLHTLHAMWEARIGGKVTPMPLSTRQRGAVLRVGLVSADLRMHPVGQFTIRAIEALNPAAIALVIYSGTTAPDALTARFRACAAQWHDIAGWSDETLATTVRADTIDVLIDMAGHTTDIRLGAFARRPAPVQLSWAGYFGTTGCAAIDGIIADRHLAPPGEEHAYHERILRLPDGYLCYDPPADAPEIQPADPARPVRFAAFHHPAKINPVIVRLWARVLATVGESTLHFTYDGFDDADVQARITGWFAAEGIDATRLHFTGRLPRTDYFAHLGDMDIALDPLPYSGGGITCDALWMGLPVVTLPGRSFAGRHSQSHLHAAGLAAFVAQDENDYVRITQSWAMDRVRLNACRMGMRARVASSALCDGARFGAHLTALLESA